MTQDNFKLIDLIVGPRDEFYIEKLYDATNIVICYIFCEKWAFVTFNTTQTISHIVLFYTALDETWKTCSSMIITN